LEKDNSFGQTEPTEFKQKIEFQHLIIQQIQRCLQSSYEGDEGKFANAVEGLVSLLPEENRKHIEDIKDEYTETVEEPVYQFSCGHRMGSVEHPVYRNYSTDWNYNPNDNGGKPILVSPKIDIVEKTNYDKLNKLVLKELELIGVTWKTEPHDRVEKRIKKPNTPLITLNDGSQIRTLIKQGLSPDAPPSLKPDEESIDHEDSEDEDDG